MSKNEKLLISAMRLDNESLIVLGCMTKNKEIKIIISQLLKLRGVKLK
jgi:hypothetical protein